MTISSSFSATIDMYFSRVLQKDSTGAADVGKYTYMLQVLAA